MARISSPEPTGKNAGSRGKTARTPLKYKRIPENFIREYVNGYNHEKIVANEGRDYRLIRSFQVDDIKVQISVARLIKIENYYDDEADIVEAVFKEAWERVPAEAKELAKEWWFKTRKNSSPNHIHLHLASEYPDYDRNDSLVRINRKDVMAVIQGGDFEVDNILRRSCPPAECRKLLRNNFLLFIARNVTAQFQTNLRSWACKVGLTMYFTEFVAGLDPLRAKHLVDIWSDNNCAAISQKQISDYIEGMERTVKNIRAIIPAGTKSPRSTR